MRDPYQSRLLPSLDRRFGRIAIPVGMSTGNPCRSEDRDEDRHHCGY
jgi:hypothetical protein